MTSLTIEELKNIVALINRAGITGEQAVTVAMLQQKLAKMLNEIAAQAGDTKPPESPMP